MAKIVILGCSLSAQKGYADYLIRQGHEVTNLAVSASSNDLQQFRMGQYFMQGHLTPDTTVIWQITGLDRNWGVLDEHDTWMCKGQPMVGHFDWLPITVALDGKERAFLLANNDRVILKKPMIDSVVLQNLAVDIYRWSLMVRQMIVVIGWKDIACPDILQLFLDWLQARRVVALRLDQAIVDWCRHVGEEFGDGQHPLETGYINWCQNNLERLLEC